MPSPLAAGPLRAYLLYLGFFALLFRDALWGGMSFMMRDIGVFYFPLWHFASDSLRHGILPLWNPAGSFGAPFLANVQTCVLYPAALLFQLPDYAWAFNFYIVLHLAMAGAFAYLWMKETPVSEPAALLSGFAFAMSGYVLSAINLTISLCSVAYFPLVLFCARRALLSRDLRWKSAAALAMALQYLAGDPAIVFGTLLVVSAAAAGTALASSRRSRRPDLSALIAWGQITALFAGLTAFQTLLFGEFLYRSDRAAIGFKEAMQWSVSVPDLAGVFLPYFSELQRYTVPYFERQSWLGNYYAGATVLVLAVVAVFGKRRHHAVLPHLLLGLAGLTLAAGRYSPVYVWLHENLPLLGFVRYPVRFFFLFNFAAACLAGFGFERLCGLPENERRLKADLRGALSLLSFAALAAAAFIVALNLRPLADRFHEICLAAAAGLPKSPDHTPLKFEALTAAAVSHAYRGLSLALLCASAVLVVTGTGRKRVRALWLIAALVVLDLAASYAPEPMVRSGLRTEPAGHLRHIASDRSLFRVMASPKLAGLSDFLSAPTREMRQLEQQDKLMPNVPALFGIPSAGGYDSIFVRESLDAVRLLGYGSLPLENRWIDALNVKYLASPQADLGPRYRLVKKSEFSNLFENAHVFPRAFLVARAVHEPDRAVVMARVVSPEYEPEAELYLDEAPPKTAAAPEKRGEATVTEYGPNRVRIDARVDGAAQWLFLSDAYYPGWKCQVDGRPTKIYRANLAFRAVPLAPGRHDVRFVYDPPLFKLGAGLSLLTLSFVLYGLTRRRPVIIAN